MSEFYKSILASEIFSIRKLHSKYLAFKIVLIVLLGITISCSKVHDPDKDGVNLALIVCKCREIRYNSLSSASDKFKKSLDDNKFKSTTDAKQNWERIWKPIVEKYDKCENRAMKVGRKYGDRYFTNQEKFKTYQYALDAASKRCLKFDERKLELTNEVIDIKINSLRE